jgi:hypothetical protein
MAVQALASQLWFYQRHYSRPRMVALVVLIQGVVLARWLLAPIRIRLTHDANRRSQLREDAMAWRRVLRGEWLRLEAGGRPR